jgi:hypothetical protein
MGERFFLNRIEMNRTWNSINEAVIFPVAVFPHPANTSFPFSHAASVRAQFALNLSSLQWSKIRREFSLNKALLSHLGMGNFWKTEERGG